MKNSPPAGRPMRDDLAPDRRARQPVAPLEADVVLEAPEIDPHQQHADADGDRTRQARARHAERPARAPAADQHRREHHVDDDGEHLHRHGRLDDAGAAQRRGHRHQRELQRQSRQVPAQVGDAGSAGGRVRTQAAGKVRGEWITEQHAGQQAGDGQHRGLVEDQVGARLVLAAHGLRDQRHGADAQHLGQRHHQEGGVAGRADAGDGRVAQAADEVQVDQEIQGLEDHAGRDRRGQAHQVAIDRTVAQVTHVQLEPAVVETDADALAARRIARHLVAQPALEQHARGPPAPAPSPRRGCARARRRGAAAPPCSDRAADPRISGRRCRAARARNRCR